MLKSKRVIQALFFLVLALALSLNSQVINPGGSGGGGGTAVKQYGGGFGTKGGPALSPGGAVYSTAAQACTITATNVLVDAGSATVKFWKLAKGAGLPTVANVINTSGISTTFGADPNSTVVSDFTTLAVAAHDKIAMTVTAVSGAGLVQATLECQ